MTKNNGVTLVRRENLLPALRTESRENVVSPSADVYETPDAFVLMLEMPGVTKDTINIVMENGVLSVKANIATLHNENAALLLRELNATTYHRLFNMADNIDRNTIDARYENGVLIIKLLKKEKSKPREIQIR